MKPKLSLSVVIAAAALLFALPAGISQAADRLKVDFSKGLAGGENGLRYLYEFIITKQKSGEPVAGAEFMITTGMASMPGAHISPPVRGEASGRPGVYSAVLDFIMAGDWNLILRFSKPHRDQVVLSDKVSTLPGGDGKMMRRKEQ